MHIDGDKHKALRKNVSKLLSNGTSIANNLDISILINSHTRKIEGSNVELDVNNLAKETTEIIMSKILGLSKDSYMELIRLSRECVKFLYLKSVTQQEINATISSIKQTKDFLSHIYMKEVTSSSSIIKQMKKNGDFSNDIIINTLVDGHDPLESSIKSMFYYATHKNLNDFKTDSNKVLSHFAPFTYCARKATTDTKVDNIKISSNGRVM